MYVTIVGHYQSNIETFVGLYAVATLCCVLMSIKLDAYLEKRSTLKTLLESNQLKNNEVVDRLSSSSVKTTITHIG